MPLDSHIDSARGLVTTRLEGRITGSEVKAHQRGLEADPDFDPDFDHLFDLSRVETFQISVEQIRAIASVSVFSSSSRRAVVAPKDVLYGLSRMYEGFRDISEEEIRVFRSREEALVWLADEGNR